MKLTVSGVTATSFYITGLIVGASFGFVAGILFLAVAYLVSKVFGKKEKEIATSNSTDSQSNDSQTNESPAGASTFSA